MRRSFFFVAALLATVTAVSEQSYEQKIDAAMKRIDGVIAKGPFKASWESLETQKAPDWYADAKFGILLYNSDLSDWNAVKMGPKRDLVGELAREARKVGLHLAASSHRAERWWFYEGGMKFDSEKLLGSRQRLKWKQEPDGLKVESPDIKPGDYAFVLRIETF